MDDSGCSRDRRVVSVDLLPPMSEPFVHDGTGPDVDPATGDEAETEELDDDVASPSA